MPILETKNLSYVYSDGTPFRVTAINNVNISIEKGEFVSTSFQRLNISSDACFIARVVAWAEMPIYE